jgi:hypothetical protein
MALCSGIGRRIAVAATSVEQRGTTTNECSAPVLREGCCDGAGALMLDPLDPLDHLGELLSLQSWDPASDDYRCDECGRVVASLPHLIDHLERRH